MKKRCSFITTNLKISGFDANAIITSQTTNNLTKTARIIIIVTSSNLVSCRTRLNNTMHFVEIRYYTYFL